MSEPIIDKLEAENAKLKATIEQRSAKWNDDAHKRRLADLRADKAEAENKRLREYISDHVHAFIDSDEVGKLMSFEEWCKL